MSTRKAGWCTCGKKYKTYQEREACIRCNHGVLPTIKQINKVLNQCDGCMAGLPLKDGIHQDGQVFGIVCTKDRYK